MRWVQALAVAACLLTISGCATGGAPSAIESPNACAMAGDNCVKNGADVRACRAAQATCEGQSAQVAAIRGQTPSSNSRMRRVPMPPLPPRPPLSPDGETILDHPDPASVADCALQVRSLIEDRLHGRIVRVLVTSGSRWGLVWRADVETPTDGPPYAQRVVCARGGIEISPMTMFKPTESLKPLPGPG
jgi:hypothetical protein